MTEEGVNILVGVIIFVVAAAIAIYVLTSLLMSNVHKRIYGKGSWMAWVPYCRTYLLGQLAVNKLVGIILLSASVLSEVLAGGAENATSIAGLLSSAVGIATIVFYILLLIKNGKLKRGELSPSLAAKQCDAMNFDEVKETQEEVRVEQPSNPEPQKTEEQTAQAEKRFCTNCGTKVVDGSAFCTNCGTKL